MHALVVDPHSSSILYAGTRQAGIYKSTNGGANWNAVDSGLKAESGTSCQADLPGVTKRGSGGLTTDEAVLPLTWILNSIP